MMGEAGSARRDLRERTDEAKEIEREVTSQVQADGAQDR